MNWVNRDTVPSINAVVSTQPRTQWIPFFIFNNEVSILDFEAANTSNLEMPHYK